MRRPQRPFTVERKRGARAAAGERPQAAPELTDFDAPAPQPQPFDHARAAAEALFGGAAGAARRKAAEENPGPASEPARTGAALPGAAPGGGRILQSLLETAATTFEAEPEPAPPRRGRKPGSRNKPKAPTEAPARAGKASAPLFDFEDESELVALETRAPERAPGVAAPAPARLSLRRPGRVERGSMPRAERWKARLPSFAR